MKILDLTNPKHQQIVVEEIARAKQIISEQSSPKLSKHKIAKWFANNRKLVSDFVYKGDIGDQNLNNILRFLQGYPSQYYLKNLIDQVDELEGVAIDDQDFYESPKSNIDFGFKEYPNVNPYEQPGGRPSRDGWTGD